MRLVRSTALRLVQEGEEEELRVYYSTENTREYHEVEEQWLEVRPGFESTFLIHIPNQGILDGFDPDLGFHDKIESLIIL